MKKRIFTLALALIMCLTLIPATAFAATPAGCPEDGTGMDSIWGYKHMEIADKVATYAKENGWASVDSIPQGWSDYEKFSGKISIRNYTNVSEGQWWQLIFSLSDNTYCAVLRLYYSDGSSIGKVASEESVGSGDLAMSELEYIIDRCTEKIGAIVLDIPSEWATAEINAAIAAGLVPDSLQQNYALPVSRGDAIQMFINLIEKNSGQYIYDFITSKGVSVNFEAFTDTDDYAVFAANALGIISGVGSSKFDPNGTFTRAQIAAIINRVAHVLGVSTAGFTHSFTDLAGHWADGELGWPVHAGIISGVGDNRFDPDGKLTTEQAIAITYRALLYFKNENNAATAPSAPDPDFLSNKICDEVREYALSLGFETVEDYTDSLGGWQINIRNASTGNCSTLGLRLAVGYDYWHYSIITHDSYRAAVERGGIYSMDEMKTLIFKCSNY
ncbi:MAG: S-layer homology domain-containing protein [Candidatus Saccharimonadales bacterium]